MAKRKIKFSNFLKSNLFLVLGLFFIFVFLFWRYHQVRILSFSSSSVLSESQTEEIGFSPVYIKSYPVGVDVEVIPAKIENNIWPVYDKKAGYIINGKNLIIYGHNKNDILGPIRYVVAGSSIILLDSSKNEYMYEVIKTDIVDPGNLKYIENTNEEQLTVYTCTGIFDSKRFIVVAKRIN